MHPNESFNVIRCLVNDQIGKYDECLVDRFLELISIGNSDVYTSFSDIVPKLYTEQEFSDANLVRVFKFHRSVLKNRCQSLVKARSGATLFWNKLPVVVAKNDLNTISAALSLLDTIVRFKSGYLWLTDLQFDPPILAPGRENNNLSSDNVASAGSPIENVASLVKFYMRARTNYHIQNQARGLFVWCIKQSCRLQINPSHNIVVSGKRAIEELLNANTPTIYHALVEILKETDIHGSLNERYNVRALIRSHFAKAIEDNSHDLNNICKCLAMVNTASDTMKDVLQLKSINKLEPIIAYVMHRKRAEIDQFLLPFIIYPILASCDSEDAQVLVPRLLMTREERNFLDRHTKDKLVTSCIVYVRKLIRQVTNNPFYIPSKDVIYLQNVVLEYIKCHYSCQKSYRNVMECCSALKDFCSINVRKFNTNIWHFQMIQTIHEILETIDISNDHTKAIAMELISRLGTVDFVRTYPRYHADKVEANLMKTTELAFKFDDHEILNEFLEFFASNIPCQDLEGFQFLQLPRYAELICTHVLPKVRETNNREVLGNLADVLVLIDLEAKPTVLSDYNMRRHHDIPRLLGDWLIEHSARHPTVERIMKCLDDSKPLATTTYPCYLDSNTLPKSVKDCLDHLAKGICITVRGESSESCRTKALCQISNLVHEYITNSSNSRFILQRLVKTQILQTLFASVKGNMFRPRIHRVALRTVITIRELVIKELQSESLANSIAEQIMEHKIEVGKMSPEGAREVANFYTIDDLSAFERQPDDGATDNREECISLGTYVNLILNQQQISSAISECY